MLSLDMGIVVFWVFVIVSVCVALSMVMHTASSINAMSMPISNFMVVLLPSPSLLFFLI